MILAVVRMQMPISADDLLDGPGCDHTVGTGGANVQDANTLKIRVTYDYPLIVSFVDRVMRGESNYVKSDGFLDPGKVAMEDPRYPLCSGSKTWIAEANGE